MNVKPTGSGWGFKPTNENHPIFINLYDKNYSQDFKLVDFLQHLKYKIVRNINPIFSKGTQPNQKLCPIVIFPDLGESDIIAKWNKTNTKMTPTVNLTKQDFEDHGKWNCREIQDKWTSIWFPTFSEHNTMNKYCWEDNIKVTYDPETKMLKDSNGVLTTLNNFGRPPMYMEKILESLTSLGYTDNQNLYGACYDFRKIACDYEMERYILSIRKMIEESVTKNGKKAIVLGHGLGSVICNYFLVQMEKEWKDKYIDCFVSFSGSFGGSPKALRTMLSGMNLFERFERDIVTKTIRNFTGLQWLLPSPHVYGNKTLLTFKNVSYTASDIPLLLKEVSPEAAQIYNELVYPKQCVSLNPPNVETYIFCGMNRDTEGFYSYGDSLLDNPMAMNDTGDGTLCECSLRYPLNWTGGQKEPVYYRYYENMEHLDILSRLDPITDFFGVLNFKK